jgi:hypothetical protein
MADEIPATPAFTRALERRLRRAVRRRRRARRLAPLAAVAVVSAGGFWGAVSVPGGRAPFDARAATQVRAILPGDREITLGPVVTCLERDRIRRSFAAAGSPVVIRFAPAPVAAEGLLLGVRSGDHPVLAPVVRAGDRIATTFIVGRRASPGERPALAPAGGGSPARSLPTRRAAALAAAARAEAAGATAQANGRPADGQALVRVETKADGSRVEQITGRGRFAERRFDARGHLRYEITESAARAVEYWPGRGRVVVFDPDGAEHDDRADAFARAYRSQIASGVTRVAGRGELDGRQVLELVSDGSPGKLVPSPKRRAPAGVSLHVFVDAETWLPLRSESRSSEGTQVLFTAEAYAIDLEVARARLTSTAPAPLLRAALRRLHVKRR